MTSELNWGDEQINYMMKLLRAMVEDIEAIKDEVGILRRDIDDLSYRIAETEWSLRDI